MTEEKDEGNDVLPTIHLNGTDHSQKQAVQIIETVEYEHVFNLDLPALEGILLDPAVADKEVAVISIAGAFRKGKSFMLNFFLRYLQNLESGGDEESWLGDNNTLVQGFSWRGGSERETNGILLWPQPFIVRRPTDGKEIAVLLMDTQGAFDSQSTVKDCATVFALSTMISSVQIFNLSGNIQEDSLQHLQLFTEYGRLALSEDDSAKPFQTLLFLVRDWQCPYEHEYGLIGGNRLLEKRLEVNDRQHPELQQLRQHIRACFSKIECFLMPHPGLSVAIDVNFKGALGEIHDDFKKMLRSLVPRILHPKNIEMKKIQGQSITCLQLLEYFKTYTKIFQGEDLPEPKSMLMATAEANNLAAVALAKEHYRVEMEKICGGDTAYLAPQTLSSEHERLRIEALNEFRAARKMGGEEFSHVFIERLEEELTTLYEDFVKVNESKNLFKSMRTPSTIVALMIFVYILQGLFAFIGLNVFESLCVTLQFGLILTLLIWSYSRYTGEYREAAQAIDDMAEWIWQNFLKPTVLPVLKQATKNNPLARSMISPMLQEGVSQGVMLTRKFSEHQSLYKPARNSTASTSSRRQKQD